MDTRGETCQGKRGGDTDANCCQQHVRGAESSADTFDCSAAATACLLEDAAAASAVRSCAPWWRRQRSPHGHPAEGLPCGDGDISGAESDATDEEEDAGYISDAHSGCVAAAALAHTTDTILQLSPESISLVHFTSSKSAPTHIVSLRRGLRNEPNVMLKIRCAWHGSPR